MSSQFIQSTEAQRLRQSLRHQILELSAEPVLSDHPAFESLSLAVFRYQAVYNPVYSAYLQHLNIRPEQITNLRQVPFMPIGFFKNHLILSGFEASRQVPPTSLTFTSSGTSSRAAANQTNALPALPERHPDRPSQHVVPDPALYDAVSTRIFERTYGSLRNFHILALLPSYLERNNSSLVYMVQRFIEQTGSDKSGFFLHNHDELTGRLRQIAEQSDGRRILLIGVTFGLLDWAESGQNLSFLGQMPNLVVMETGGMKGRRKELLREEVHKLLTDRLGVETIHSEYGMTELLSQAYSTGKGVFRSGPTMRVFLRDINDPFLIYPDEHSRAYEPNTGSRQTGERRTGSRQTGERRTGGINVVDLANLDSCAFIETGDLGQYVSANEDTGERLFRVIGRFDNSDVRGCNLMVL